MVRWGLVFCAVVFTVMLLIPMPLRQGGSSHASVVAGRSLSGDRELSPVAAPRAGAALMSLPDAVPAEVPVPMMPAELQSVAATAAPAIPAMSPPAAEDDKTGVVPALAIRLPKAPPEAYSVAAAQAELRSGPSSLERSTAKLARGDRVEVLSRFADRWLFVRLADGKTEGYLDATQMSPAD